MLVLTRKQDECIRIGDGIIIKILENSGSQVKLGITVPRKIPIYREEIYQKIQQENREAILSAEKKPDILNKLTAHFKKSFKD